MEENMKRHDKEMGGQTRKDWISNLPWHVIDIILVRLPLRDAARTSILSSTWRDKWTCLSQFVFDDKCIPRSLLDKAARWVQIMKIIDKVRAKHSGSIEKFKLAACCLPNHSDLDQWINFVTEKGIKELVIREFSFTKHFQVPSSVFCCPYLSCLELYGSIVQLPSSFWGFACLKSLCLSHVSIESHILETLVSNCPVLERLTLLEIDHLTFVRIHNPKLNYLRLNSKFEDICLENSPNLACVDISMIPAGQHPEEWEVCNLVRIMGCLDGVSRISLSGPFLEFLANDNVPHTLPTTLKCLLALNLKAVLFSPRDTAASISILRSAPNLQDFVITVDTQSTVIRSAMDLVTTESTLDFYFSQLKTVKIRGIVGPIEWAFLKLILSHSPVLESMTIVNYNGLRIPDSQLLELERASEHVKFTSLTL